MKKYNAVIFDLDGVICMTDYSIQIKNYSIQIQCSNF